jgi:putative ABC transport system permease protein
MDLLFQDLRFAVRSLRRQPGFALVAVVTMALGVGANTAIFGVVNTVVIRPLPYVDGDRLAAVGQTFARYDWDWGPVSFPNYTDWRDQSTAFESLAAYTRVNRTMLGGDAPEQVTGAAVTANLFPLLGAVPLLGRTMSDEEDGSGGSQVIVLSHRLWTRRFAADSGVIGQTVRFETLMGAPVGGAGDFTVIGVMPARFAFPSPTREFWIPLYGAAGRERDTNFLSVIGRLAEGETLASASVEMEGIAARLVAAYPDANEGIGTRVRSQHELVVGDAVRLLVMLLGVVGVVLAIACANIASLLLSRAVTRQREMAVRTALGASRRRLVRQLLTESSVLALVGGALGVAIAVGLTNVLLAIGPADIPRRGEIGVDGTALLFALVVSLAAGLVFGLVPALQSSNTPAQRGLKEAVGVAGGAARHRMHRVLVVSQVAMALVLLIGAGLLTSSFARLVAVDPGFDPSRVLGARVELPMMRYQDSDQVHRFFDELTAGMRGSAGVRDVGTTFSLPFSGSSASRTFVVEGRGMQVGEELVAGNVIVGGRYFQTMGISVVRGRGFAAGDGAGAPLVGLVNETMARQVWPGEDPIGQRIKFGNADEDNPWVTVVGIAGDVRRRDLADGAQAELYQPHAQVGWARSMFVVVKSDGDPLDHASGLRAQVQALDPNLPVTGVSTVQQLVFESVAQPRFRTLLVGIFAVVAGVLALVGIYGLMAFFVSERVREIGIRMALGAGRREVLSGVLGQGMRLTLLGVAVGIGGAVAATRVLRSFLFGIDAMDPVTFVLVPILLLAMAALACYLPAVRASRVDPMVAMRNE